MVKILFKFAILAFFLMILSLVGASVWLLASTGGARATLNTLSAYSPIQIEFTSLSGRLADELTLAGVRLHWPGGSAETPILQLRWQPFHLLHGRLEIQELALGKITIQLPAAAPSTSSSETTPLHWPLISGTPLQVNVVLESLRLAGLELQRTDAEPFLLGASALRLDWKGGILRASRLDTQTPYGNFSGEVAAGLVTASLFANLQGKLRDERPIKLHLDLAAGKETELLAGPLQLDLGAGKEGTLHLQGELGLASSGAELRELLLTRSAAAGEVRGLLRYHFSTATDPLTLQLQLKDLDLTPEAGIATSLSGLLNLNGSENTYQGNFDLQNVGSGWHNLTLAGNLNGNRQSLALTELAGKFLTGELGGSLNLDWSGPFALKASLHGEDLNPGIVSAPLDGTINFDLTSTLLLQPDAPLQLELVTQLHESTLHGHPLSGEIDARLEGEDLLLRRLELHGQGIDLTAKGRVKERVNFSVAVARLDELLPEATGQAQAAGWLRWQKGELSGAIDGSGKALSYAGVKIAQGTIKLQRQTPQSPFALHTVLNTIRYQERSIQRLELHGDGSPEEHQLLIALSWPQGQLRIDGAGGYQEGRWSGKILHLAGEDQEQGAWRMAAPVTLIASAEALRFSSLELSSERGERLGIVGAYDLKSQSGEVIAQWDDLALNRVNPWLTEQELSGATTGTVEGHWNRGGKVQLQGKIVAAGRVEQGDLSLEIQRLAGDLSWDDQGLLAQGDLDLALGGRLSGKLTSPERGNLALPKRLTLHLDWEELGPELFARWMPTTLAVSGKLSGGLTAELFPEGALDVSGDAAIDDGLLIWVQTKGKMIVPLRNAEVNWRWRDKSLLCDLAVVLADYGRIAGSLSLPIPALLPIAIAPTGKLWGEVEGNLKEEGLLSALLPGLLRESHGDLKLDLTLGGSWKTPTFAGGLQMNGAGAYLPQAGIEVHDLTLKSEFAGDHLRLLSLEVTSGGGKLKGEGDLRLQNWKIGEFNGTLAGERFLAVNLPELRLVVSPALTVSGTPKKLKLRGEVKLPELLVRGRQTSAPLRQNADVIILDASAEAPPEAPLALDLEVRLLLGERVMVDFGGIDARLAGDVLLNARNLDEIKGRGEIHVDEGSYAAYGMKLEVERGTLLFSGGAIDQPTLDIIALRKAGEVKAGVRVSGTPRAPIVKLYADPMMPDTDILSYIVLGRPMGSDTGQANLLLIAAGALLAKGESTVLQDRLKRRVGLDVLDIQAGSGDVTTSMITLGKYLNPKLYVSLGHSLFTGTNVVGLRYNISERWQAESTVGVESGVDLFYTVEFR